VADCAANFVAFPASSKKAATEVVAAVALLIQITCSVAIHPQPRCRPAFAVLTFPVASLAYCTFLMHMLPLLL
jgi:hypothetical protein